jgi:hypothetical protein
MKGLVRHSSQYTYDTSTERIHNETETNQPSTQCLCIGLACFGIGLFIRSSFNTNKLNTGVFKMEINNKNLCNNELRKIALLMTKASDLGMNLSSYGFADVNPNSGYTYLWLEDYPFTLFINVDNDKIWSVWSHPEDGEETFLEVTEDTTLDALYDWVAELEEQVEEV